MKVTLPFFFFFFCFLSFSQEQASNYKTKKVIVKDSILVDSVSINSSKFLVKFKNGITLDSTFYNIDFSRALLTFKKPIETDSSIIEYLRFPDFLTRTYKQLDKSIIVENTSNLDKLYKLSQPSKSYFSLLLWIVYNIFFCTLLKIEYNK